MNFSVVIPTYNRKKDIEECLDSILRQTILPTEILVIDDGELPLEFVDKERKMFEDKKINFVYYKKSHQKEKRGSSESRNIALGLAEEKIIFILDDDVILDNNFLEKIVEIWVNNENKKLIGVGGIIKNNRQKEKFEKIYNIFFGLVSKYRWDITPVGFQVWDDKIKEKEKGHYAHGGVCSYNKNLTQKLKFTTFGGGRTALEDVDFCLRAKNKGYHFMIEPTAKVIHEQSKTSRENNFLIGTKEGCNRKIIFKNNCQKSFKNYLWFHWSNIGWTLRQFLSGNFLKFLGIIKGSLFETHEK
jgi:GT2 family glycosyltransferase